MFTSREDAVHELVHRLVHQRVVECGVAVEGEGDVVVEHAQERRGIGAITGRRQFSGIGTVWTRGRM